eukprot:5576253-Pyramimonas_sp.AAC.1
MGTSGCPWHYAEGRSMLSNVVDIEHAATMAALEDEDAAIVLFDFIAAFASVSRKYLLSMARASGFADTAMTVLSSFYHLTVGTLSLHGALYGQ